MEEELELEGGRWRGKDCSYMEEDILQDHIYCSEGRYNQEYLEATLQ